jgi:ABC-type multidrug transport system fused ATPase/permease subunit
VMDEGQVVGEGTHETLLRSSAMYRSFCLQQSVA